MFLATIVFCHSTAQPCKGHVVRLHAIPRIGERLELELESFRILPDERLHVRDWKVFDVVHSLDLSHIEVGPDRNKDPEVHVSIHVVPDDLTSSTARRR